MLSWVVSVYHWIKRGKLDETCHHPEAFDKLLYRAFRTVLYSVTAIQGAPLRRHVTGDLGLNWPHFRPQDLC